MADNFYPLINALTEPEQTTTKDLPLYKEIAWDFKNDTPLLNNHEFRIIEKNDAISVWIYHALKTQKDVYPIYSDKFGNEIVDLFGENYTNALVKSEISRYVHEALEVNEYIVRINKVEVNFSGSLLEISVDVTTIYNELEVSFVV